MGAELPGFSLIVGNVDDQMKGEREGAAKSSQVASRVLDATRFN